MFSLNSKASQIMVMLFLFFGQWFLFTALNGKLTFMQIFCSS